MFQRMLRVPKNVQLASNASVCLAIDENHFGKTTPKKATFKRQTCDFGLQEHCLAKCQTKARYNHHQPPRFSHGVPWSCIHSLEQCISFPMMSDAALTFIDLPHHLHELLDKKINFTIRMWLTQCTKNVGLLKPECNYIYKQWYERKSRFAACEFHSLYTVTMIFRQHLEASGKIALDFYRKKKPCRGSLHTKGVCHKVFVQIHGPFVKSFPF